MIVLGLGEANVVRIPSDERVSPGRHGAAPAIAGGRALRVSTDGRRRHGRHDVHDERRSRRRDCGGVPGARHLAARGRRVRWSDGARAGRKVGDGGRRARGLRRRQPAQVDVRSARLQRAVRAAPRAAARRVRADAGVSVAGTPGPARSTTWTTGCSSAGGSGRSKRGWSFVRSDATALPPESANTAGSRRSGPAGWRRIPASFSPRRCRWPSSAFASLRPGSRNAVCDRLNVAIVQAVNASGDAYLTHTRVGGRVVMRVGIGNILTTVRHLEQAWARVVQEAEQVTNH